VSLYGLIFSIDNKRKSLDTISQMSGSPSGYGPSICSKGNEYHVLSVIFRSLITRVVVSYKELRNPENTVSIIIIIIPKHYNNILITKTPFSCKN